MPPAKDFSEMSESDRLKMVDKWIEEHGEKIENSEEKAVTSIKKRALTVLGWLSNQFGLGERAPCLPQDSTPEELEKRKQAIIAQQRIYQYSYNTNLPGAPSKSFFSWNTYTYLKYFFLCFV